MGKVYWGHFAYDGYLNITGKECMLSSEPYSSLDMPPTRSANLGGEMAGKVLQYVS